MKKIALNTGIQAGVAVGVTVLLAIVLGIVVANVGGTTATVVRVLFALSVIVLALFYLIATLIWAAVYAGASIGLAWVEGKQQRALGWVNGKTLWVEDRVGVGLERFVIRPLARATHAAVGGAAFVHHFAVGPAERLDLRSERSGWRTRLNRLRHRAFPPPTGREPKYRGERDMQPGPGIAV